jgi:RsiW-degrading membrane proteinase PrsW (M82 family)
MFLILLFVAVAPGLFLLWYFYHRDKFEHEPKKLIFKIFFFGSLTVIPAIIFEVILEKAFDAFTSGVLNVFLVCFIAVAPVEEILKFFVVRNWAYNRPEFDEIMDGIVYAVSASLGFATLENIMYVLSNGLGVGVIRAFLAVPGHAMYGAIMGFFIGRAKFNAPHASRLMTTGVLLAILFHGIYDFLLLTKTAFAVLVIVLLVVLGILIRKQLKRAELQSLERKTAEEMTKECLTTEDKEKDIVNK